MTDFWGFLLQTLYVSLVGGLLLVVKAIFRDKLTPKWQYGVWSVLLLSACMIETVSKLFQHFFHLRVIVHAGVDLLHDLSDELTAVQA